MKINAKLQAFTILEMVITMMISALIIGFALTAYMIVIRAHASFQQKNDQTAALLQLDRVLQRDIGRGIHMLKTANGILIAGKTDSVRYEFTTDYVLRISRRTDTTRVQMQDLQTTFEQQPVDKGLTDEISFKVTCNQQTIPLTYHKYYSSEDLFNQEPYAIN
ncbi:MAG: type II secretion system protein [Bacteroidota bacterium]